jgi:uncharacterized protein YkwD
MRFLCTIICLFLALAAPVDALAESLARQVLFEINLARTEPATYAGFIREFRKQFRGKFYNQPDRDSSVQTREGVSAVDEAITFLSRQKPLPPLAWSNGLAAAADELVEEQGKSGGTGHINRQNNGPQQRVERHGIWEKMMAEDIGYGPDNARSMVIQLIIDDGVKDRGHRKNIFTRAFGTAGVACGSHPRYQNMCVIDFAGGFRE